MNLVGSSDRKRVQWPRKLYQRLVQIDSDLISQNGIFEHLQVPDISVTQEIVPNHRRCPAPHLSLPYSGAARVFVLAELSAPTAV